MAWLMLALGVWDVLFVVNARWPARQRVLLAPSFFAAWLTIELAPFHVLWQAVLAVLLILGGALDSWAGWLGLALQLVALAGMVVIQAESWRSLRILRDALVHVTGDEPGPGVPLTQVLLPFAFKRKGVRRIRNLEFGRAGGRTQRLDVYLPEGPAQGLRRPAVLQIHGGAWVIGDKREQGLLLLNHLAANGWVGFNANYRLSPFATFPDHLVDCKRALAWIREHADEYGVDPDFVCVTGGSAGGHLTALMALTPNDPRYQPGFEDADTSVQAAVPFYGVYDFTNRLGTQHPDFLPTFLEPWVMKTSFDQEPQKFHDASPIDLVRPDAPPFFALHGDHDTLAPLEDARLFVDRLRAVSREPVLFAELKGAQHAFEIFGSVRARAAVTAVERFLTWAHERHVAGPAAAPLTAPHEDDLAVLRPDPTAQPTAPAAPSPAAVQN